MLKKILISVYLLTSIIITFNFVEASNYEWDIGGLKQMDYDAIEEEEVEVELSFYCGVDNAMEGGATSAAGKTLVYGNLANNYYTGIKSINGGSSWENLNNGYSLGTNVYIKDVGLFTIEDRGGSSDFNNTNRMDLFVARKSGESDEEYERRTNSYGHQKVKAKIIKNGTDRIWIWPSGNTLASPSSQSDVVVSDNTNSNRLNFKIVYTVGKTVTVAGTKPIILTTNCKDAISEYWSKTTFILGEDTTLQNQNNGTQSGQTVETPIINTGDDKINALLDAAVSQLGYTEVSVNDTKFGEWYGMNKQPWCAMFVSWCANEAGMMGDIIPKYAACVSGKKWYQDKGRYYSSRSGYIPKAGDTFFFIYSSTSGHTGLVLAYADGYVYTVEGNYSNKVVCRKVAINSFDGFGSNGGQSLGTIPASFSENNGGSTR